MNGPCSKCGQFARYPFQRLIDQHDGNGTIIAWLDGLTADCPRKRVAAISDQCHAPCPDLTNAVAVKP